MTLRSASVRYANAPMTRLMITKAWSRLTTTRASCRLHHLDRRVEVAGVLAPRPRHASASSCSRCAELDRGAVRAERARCRRTRSRRSASAAESSTRVRGAGSGARDPLDRRSREQRAVPLEPELAGSGRRPGSASGCRRSRPCGRPAPCRAGRGAWPIVEQGRGTGGPRAPRRRRRLGCDLDSEPRTELRDPGELVRAGGPFGAVAARPSRFIVVPSRSRRPSRGGSGRPSRPRARGTS